MERIFLWVPRILAIVFICFISIFALDVFSSPYWVLPLFMHLIPSVILVFLTGIAWRHKTVGGVAYLLMAFGSFFFMRSSLITFPVLIIGLCFILSGIVKIK